MGKYGFPQKKPWKSFYPVSTLGYRKGLVWFESFSVFPMVSGGLAKEAVILYPLLHLLSQMVITVPLLA